MIPRTRPAARDQRGGADPARLELDADTARDQPGLPRLLRFRGLLAVVAEHHLDGPLIGTAHDAELDRAAARRLERVEQVVGGADPPARGRPHPGPSGAAAPRGPAFLRGLADQP